MSIKFPIIKHKQKYDYDPHRPNKDKDEGKKNACDKKAQKDIFTDTPLRYFGYSDDTGAAVKVLCDGSKKPIVKALPVISYIPAGIYIIADVASTYNKTKEAEGKKAARKKAFGEAIFQGITNIAFPILIVGAAQKALSKGFDKFIPKLKQEFMPAGEKIINRKRDIALALGGLGTLFAVSKPIDNFSDNILMKKVINPVLGVRE